MYLILIIFYIVHPQNVRFYTRTFSRLIFFFFFFEGLFFILENFETFKRILKLIKIFIHQINTYINLAFTSLFITLFFFFFPLKHQFFISWEEEGVVIWPLTITQCKYAHFLYTLLGCLCKSDIFFLFGGYYCFIYPIRILFALLLFFLYWVPV